MRANAPDFSKTFSGYFYDLRDFHSAFDCEVSLIGPDPVGYGGETSQPPKSGGQIIHRNPCQIDPERRPYSFSGIVPFFLPIYPASVFSDLSLRSEASPVQ